MLLATYKGRTFKDKVAYGKRNVKEKVVVFRLSGVCVYPNSLNTLLFEYYDSEKYKERPEG